MRVDPSDVPFRVAVKLAFSSSDKSTLHHEFALYCHLKFKKVRGIPRVFGLFVDTELVDGDEGPHALVMTFAGHSLVGRENDINHLTQ
jgi:hypothetical protein